MLITAVSLKLIEMLASHAACMQNKGKRNAMEHHMCLSIAE